MNDDDLLSTRQLHNCSTLNKHFKLRPHASREGLQAERNEVERRARPPQDTEPLTTKTSTRPQ
jgi:hypothetical protein